MTSPNYPRRRRALVTSAARTVNSRTFVSINGNEPFGVRGELYRALVLLRKLVHEVRDMQAELDRRPESPDSQEAPK